MGNKPPILPVFFITLIGIFIAIGFVYVGLYSVITPPEATSSASIQTQPQPTQVYRRIPFTPVPVPSPAPHTPEPTQAPVSNPTEPPPPANPSPTPQPVPTRRPIITTPSFPCLLKICL